MELSEALRVQIVEGMNEKEHCHQDIELDYILNGSIQLMLESESYFLEKENIILINSNRKHSWKKDGDNLLCRVYIDYAFFTGMTGQNFINFWCNSALGQDSDYSKLHYILNEIVKEYCTLGGKESFRLYSLCFRLAECLSDDFRLKEAEIDGNVRDERIEQAIRYINQHFSRNITIKEIASEVYMSDAYFSRLFKKIAKINFQEYVNMVRMQHAVESLLYSRKSVTETAVESGFSNVSAFNKIFKKIYNCSPTQYRSEMRKNILRADDRILDSKVHEKLEKLLNHKNEFSVVDKESNVIMVKGCTECLYEKEGNFAINMGLATDILQAELRNHLCNIKQNIGFRYIRISNLFHESMYIVGKGKDFNFSLLDDVLDYIIVLGLSPWIDFADRPKRAYLDFGRNLFEDCEQLWHRPKPEEWEILLQAFFNHVTSRYGREKVSEWLFELTDAGYHEIDACKNDEHGYTYEEIWKLTYRVMKKVCPDYQLGGDGFQVHSDYEKLLDRVQFWNETGMKPDFYTIYGYPYTRQTQRGNVYAKRETDWDFNDTGIRKYKKILDKCGIKDARIFFAEWNTSISERNYYNDSCAKAAHIVRMLIAFAGTGCRMCYNHGSDYLSQYFDTAQPLVGAVGLLTKDGVSKPVYYAFAFMARLYSDIVSKGENYIVTKNAKGSYQAVICNPKRFGHNYFLKSESAIKVCDLENIFEDDEEIKICMLFPEIANCKYRIKTRLLMEQSGTPLAEWRNMGYIGDLDIQDIEHMKKVCCPKVYCEEREVCAEGLKLELCLKAHQVMHIHIYPKEDN